MKSWWRRRPLSFRLAMWYSLVGALLLTLFSVTIYGYVSKRMAQPLGSSLRRDLANVRSHLSIAKDGTLQWNGAPLRSGARWTEHVPWFDVWDAQGQLVGRWWTFDDRKMQHLDLPPVRRRETFSVFEAAPNVPLRTLSVPLEAEGLGPGWMLRVIRIHRPAADALSALAGILVGSLPIVVAVLVCGGWLVTRRWLKPLDRLVVEAREISAEDLGRRLHIANPHDEIGQLATVFNDTIARLESSFKTLDQFVANASHELRTPLTTLRSVGEVGLARDRAPEEYRDIIGSMLEEATRLELLVQRLLQLARAEGGRELTHVTTVRLDEVLEELAAELSLLAEEKEHRLVLEARARTVRTDRVLFRQAVQNLVENAIKYTPPGSTIRIGVRDDQASVHVEVTDNGGGIPVEQQERLSDRFYRGNAARSSDEPGFGLGLSLTRAYMRVLGGSLEYEPATPSGSTFRLTLPAT